MSGRDRKLIRSDSNKTGLYRNLSGDWHEVDRKRPEVDRE